MNLKFKLICYDREHYRVPVSHAIGEERASKYDLNKIYTNIDELEVIKEEIQSLIPQSSGYYVIGQPFDTTVEPILYKQIDREMKKDINGMERMLLGEKGVGLLEHLGVTPSKIQRSLDDLEQDRKRRMMLRNSDKMFEWLKQQEGKSLDENEIQQAFARILLEEE